MTSGNTSAASVCLQQLSRDNESMNTVILNKALAEYQSMGDEDREALLSIEGLAGRRLVKQMRKLCEEHNLFSWVERQNLSKGIAPRTAVVHDHLKTTHSIDFGCGTSSAKKRSQQQWLRRWRRRWDVNMGRITARETLPENECQYKAFSFLRHSIISEPSARTFGLHLAKQRIPNRGRIVVPVSGPRDSGAHRSGPPDGPSFESVFGQKWNPRQKLCGNGRTSYMTTAHQEGHLCTLTLTRQTLNCTSTVGTASW